MHISASRLNSPKFAVDIAMHLPEIESWLAYISMYRHYLVYYLG